MLKIYSFSSSFNSQFVGNVAERNIAEYIITFMIKSSSIRGARRNIFKSFDILRGFFCFLFFCLIWRGRLRNQAMNRIKRNLIKRVGQARQVFKRSLSLSRVPITSKCFTTFNYEWVGIFLFDRSLVRSFPFFSRTLMHFDNLLMDKQRWAGRFEGRYRKQQVIIEPQIICPRDLAI